MIVRITEEVTIRYDFRIDELPPDVIPDIHDAEKMKEWFCGLGADDLVIAKASEDVERRTVEVLP